MKMPELLGAEGDIQIRKMQGSTADFTLFLKWMTDPEIMRYWDGMNTQYTYEKVVQKYQEHLDEQVTQCIIVYQQQEIGYCQFYALTPEEYEVSEREFFQFVAPSEKVYGIDIFLGERRNQGIGSKALKLLMHVLFTGYHADVLMIDPKTHNQRAIRCYHKCGFEDYFVAPQREEQDGILYDSLIMGARNPDLRKD